MNSELSLGSELSKSTDATRVSEGQTEGQVKADACSMGWVDFEGDGPLTPYATASSPQAGLSAPIRSIATPSKARSHPTASGNACF